MNMTELQDDPRSKSTVLAALMSVAPGLGQVYVGYYQQGFINILVVASLVTVLVRGMGDFQPFCGIFLAFYWLFNIVDAWRRATLYNHALRGMGSSDLPERISARPGRESFLAGAVMMLAGSVLLAHTRFGISLYWLEQWWPLAFVGMGAYLIFAALTDRHLSTGAPGA